MSFPPNVFADPPPPLSQYDDLRSRQDVSSEIRDGSFVVKVHDESSQETTRLLHLASFMPLSVPGASGFDRFGRPIRIPFNDPFVYWEAAGMLAMNHFNQRDGSILHDLPRRLAGCNLRLTMSLHDTQISPIQSSRQLYRLVYNRTHSLETPIPGGLIGPVLSTVTKPLAVLAGVQRIPQVSPASSSAKFDTEHTSFPTLARTIPANPVYARATVELLSHWKVTHAGCVYPLRDLGVTFLEELVRASSEKGIQLTVAGYSNDSDEESVRRALQQVQNLRYIVPVITGQPEKIVVPASEMGMMSDRHVWMIPQAADLLQPTFTLPRSKEQYARAVHGAVVVDMKLEENPSFLGQMVAFKFNPLLRSYFVNRHAEPHIFDLYNWTASIPIITSFAYTNYDAVMAVGISACEAQGEFFTGQQHFQQLTSTEFQGLSGRVNFDAITGTRRFEGVTFGFTNVLIDEEASTSETIRFKSRVSLVLDTTNFTNSAENIHEIVPFVFRDGSNIPPPSLPPLASFDMNTIGLGVRLFGWCLAGAAALLALSLGVWTLSHRKDTLVRLSQPVFLGMMCFGTFLMALSVFALGWQEPWPFLDEACMLAPWLLTLGFSTAFSALFTKTWRINRLFKSAANMNRVKVQAKDVLWPFVAMTVSNVVVLAAWTVVSPLRWERRLDPQNVDAFGRSMESSGYCVGDNQVFWIVLGLFNFVMILFANYQSYVGRNVPNELNESIYVAASMASLLECFLIGAPILLMVAGNPASEFIGRAVLIAFSCASVLVPIYVHKFRARHRSEFDVTSSLSKSWRSTTSRRGSQSRSLSVSLGGESNGSTEFHDTVARLRANLKQKQKKSFVQPGESVPKGDHDELLRPNRGLRASIPADFQTIKR